jgi:hypothetical protein
MTEARRDDGHMSRGACDQGRMLRRCRRRRFPYSARAHRDGIPRAANGVLCVRMRHACPYAPACCMRALCEPAPCERAIEWSAPLLAACACGPVAQQQAGLAWPRWCVCVWRGGGMANAMRRALPGLAWGTTRACKGGTCRAAHGRPSNVMNAAAAATRDTVLVSAATDPWAEQRS